MSSDDRGFFCCVTCDLWAVGTDNHRVPTEDELAAAKNFVGREHLQLHDGKVHVDKGVKLNLDGVDIVRKIFAAHGISDGSIDFGTSTIFAVGRKKISLRLTARNNFTFYIAVAVVTAEICYQKS